MFGPLSKLVVAFVLGVIGSVFGVRSIGEPIRLPEPEASPAAMAVTIIPTPEPTRQPMVSLPTPTAVSRQTKPQVPTVKPDTAPAVWFTKPQDGRILTNTQQLEIEASGNMAFSKVEFFIQSGVVINTLTSRPYAFVYDLPSHMTGITGRQNVMLEVRAYDSRGRMASNIVRIFVDPAPTPTATPKPQPVSSMDLRLGPPPGSPTPNGTGTVHIDLTGISSHYSNSPDYRIFDFTWRGRVEGLKPNRTYKILLCMKNRDECGGSSDMNKITTDGCGNADFRLPPAGSDVGGVGYTVRRDNPIASVVILGQDECAAYSSPCLFADYPLGTTGF
jgi:hypothetical protein